MRAPTLFGGLALAAATVCLALGGPDGLAAGTVLGLGGLVWLLGPVGGVE